MELLSLTPGGPKPSCATMGFVPATSPTAPEPGFHALALARASGALHPRSVPLFRCHADHSAGAGRVPPVFRRAPDGTGPARRAGAHHQQSGSRRDRAAPDRDAERRRVSWRTRTSRGWRPSGAANSPSSRCASRRTRAAPIPAEPDELRQTMSRYMAAEAGDAAAQPMAICSRIAAPHVSPEGGWQSYRAAYRQLKPGAPRPHLRDPGDLALGSSPRSSG